MRTFVGVRRDGERGQVQRLAIQRPTANLFDEAGASSALGISHLITGLPLQAYACIGSSSFRTAKACSPVALAARSLDLSSLRTAFAELSPIEQQIQ